MSAKLRVITRQEVAQLHRARARDHELRTYDQIVAMTLVDKIFVMIGGRIPLAGAQRVW